MSELVRTTLAVLGLGSPDAIASEYRRRCRTPSDINEHLPTLRRYAARVHTVIECGTRSCISSWALLRGLQGSRPGARRLTACDLVRHANVEQVSLAARDAGIAYRFVEGNDLELDFPPAELVFIDTWHVYAHLKRELAKFSALASRYLLLHDTSVDAELGESLRMGWDIARQAEHSGYPEAEIARGIWPAVEEFLEAGVDWQLGRRYTNNNGLTVLVRR